MKFVLNVVRYEKGLVRNRYIEKEARDAFEVVEIAQTELKDSKGEELCKIEIYTPVHGTRGREFAQSAALSCQGNIFTTSDMCRLHIRKCGDSFCTIGFV